MVERLNDFARNVIAVMTERKLSTSTLAASAKIAPKTLNNILKGRHAAQADSLIAIAEALGTPMWQLWLPEMPTDMAPDDTFPRLVTTAAKLSPEARKQVARIADLELAAADRA